MGTLSGDSGDNQVPAITGTNNSGGFGVIGVSTYAGPPSPSIMGIGVLGKSDTFVGVAGQGPMYGVSGSTESASGSGVDGACESGYGVTGRSSSGEGVYGLSTSGTGVHGHSSNGNGVYGDSESGVGVYGAGSPAGKFDGDVEVRGDVRLVNADCSEEFEIANADRIEPGTVMVLGEDGRLEPSQFAYDKRVAGVISGAGDYKPGIILDKQGKEPNRRPVGLVGKVYCKVDATYSPIQIGNLLTTSPTPGHAMKATDQVKAFGAVIGKALRPFEAGRGLIPILIALQ